jgi:DNA-binding SARP family transcriptional activator
VARALGNAELAREHVRVAGVRARQHRDRPALAEALELEASLSPDRARVLLDQALSVWRAVGDPVGEARTTLRLAEQAAAVEPDRALGLVLVAEQRLRALGARGLSAQAATLAARLQNGTSGTSVRCLGAFRVLRDGVAVTTGEWGSRKPREVLKLLVSARGGPLTREELMAVLWPDQEPQLCAGRLSVALSVLRRVLDVCRREGVGDALVVTRESVRLDLEVVDVDVERFLRLSEQGQRQLAQGQASAQATLEAAEALYGGEFLAEDRYEDWAVPLRDHVLQTYGAVLRSLVDLPARTTDADARLRRYLRLLELDPYDEGAHLGLVETLLRARRHGEARRRYDRYVARMRELGLPAQPLPVPGTWSGG